MAAAVLVTLRAEEVEQEAQVITYALANAKSRVYLYLTGPLATEPPSPATLDALAHCYGPVSRCKPMFDLVPLFPSVGWTPERLAELPGIEELVASAAHLDEVHSLLDAVNAARERLLLPSLSLTLTASGATAAAGDQQQQQQQGQGQGQGSRVLGTPGWQEGSPLRFSKVAVGGTFDRLHAGHRLLLAATALVSTAYIFVGITAQKLLEKKKDRELLEGYDVREQAAVDYMQAVNPGVRVISGPLNDPNEPPICATDPAFDGLVVSEETIPGAAAINATRMQLGFVPVMVVVVGLVAAHGRAAHADGKLSSTALRGLEAGGGRGGAERAPEPAGPQE